MAGVKGSIGEKVPLAQTAYRVLKREGIAHLANEASDFVAAKIDEKLLLHLPLYHDVKEEYYIHKHTYLAREYDAPLNPYKIEWVDPADINEFTRREVRPAKVCGEIKGGDWDVRKEFIYSDDYSKVYWHSHAREGVRFEDSLFYQSLRDHFEHGVGWKETEYYRSAIEAFERGEKISNGYTSAGELLDDFKRTDELHEEIRTEGYKSQNDMREEYGYDGGGTTFKQLKKSEITVDIGRNGELLFAYGGKHRLAIAKILGLEEVPVVFLCRHKEWMEHREYVHRNELRVRHPDFREFQGR